MDINYNYIRKKANEISDIVGVHISSLDDMYKVIGLLGGKVSNGTHDRHETQIVNLSNKKPLNL